MKFFLYAHCSGILIKLCRKSFCFKDQCFERPRGTQPSPKKCWKPSLIFQLLYTSVDQHLVPELQWLSFDPPKPTSHLPILVSCLPTFAVISTSFSNLPPWSLFTALVHWILEPSLTRALVFFKFLSHSWSTWPSCRRQKRPTSPLLLPFSIHFPFCLSMFLGLHFSMELSLTSSVLFDSPFHAEWPFYFELQLSGTKELCFEPKRARRWSPDCSLLSPPVLFEGSTHHTQQARNRPQNDHLQVQWSGSSPTARSKSLLTVWCSSSSSSTSPNHLLAAHRVAKTKCLVSVKHIWGDHGQSNGMSRHSWRQYL